MTLPCVSYIFFLHISTEYGLHHFHYIYYHHVAGIKKLVIMVTLHWSLYTHLSMLNSCGFVPLSQNILFDNIVILWEVSRKKYQS